MIDMGAVLGGRATVGKNCHVGAGAVLAGVVEPASATPVIVEDNVLIGANAVAIKGCRIGHDAVVAAGAVVVGDVEPNTVVAGCPARVIKMKDEKTAGKTALVDALRATVVFEPEYRDPAALRGLEGFSHLWLLWLFSASVRAGWSPTVRPLSLIHI